MRSKRLIPAAILLAAGLVFANPALALAEEGDGITSVPGAISAQSDDYELQDDGELFVSGTHFNLFEGGAPFPWESMFIIYGWEHDDSYLEDQLASQVTVKTDFVYNAKPGSYRVSISGPSTFAGYRVRYSDGTINVEENPDKTTITYTEPNSDGSTTLTFIDTEDGSISKQREHPNRVSYSTYIEPGKDTEVYARIPDGVDSATLVTSAEATAATVAFDIDTGDLVRLCVPGEEGLLIKVDQSCRMVIRDNAKSFSDMGGHWASDAVKFASARGLMNGVGGTTRFDPDASTSRAMVCAVLSNLEGGAEATDAPSFTDVAAGSWYADAVAWASERGIVNGYGNGRFGPSDDVTREQMACMLYNYAKATGMDVTERADLSGFADAYDLSYGRDAMSWCVAEGIFHGYGDGTRLGATNGLTRAQCAAVLMNLVTLIVQG